MATDSECRENLDQLWEILETPSTALTNGEVALNINHTVVIPTYGQTGGRISSIHPKTPKTHLFVIFLPFLCTFSFTKIFLFLFSVFCLLAALFTCFFLHHASHLFILFILIFIYTFSNQHLGYFLHELNFYIE